MQHLTGSQQRARSMDKQKITTDTPVIFHEQAPHVMEANDFLAIPPSIKDGGYLTTSGSERQSVQRQDIEEYSNKELIDMILSNKNTLMGMKERQKERNKKTDADLRAKAATITEQTTEIAKLKA